MTGLNSYIFELDIAKFTELGHSIVRDFSGYEKLYQAHLLRACTEMIKENIER